MITPDLKRLYASAPANHRIFQVLILSNPAWSEEIRLCDNTIEPIQFDWGGVLKIFQPSIFEVELPRLDSQQLPELSISIPNFGQVLIDYLDAAVAGGQPITVQMTSFTDYDDKPGIWPALSYEMSEVALNEQWCTGTARREDFINRSFPREIFTVQKFPGLYR